MNKNTMGLFAILWSVALRPGLAQTTQDSFSVTKESPKEAQPAQEQAEQTLSGPISFQTPHLSPEQRKAIASKVSDIFEFYSGRYGSPGRLTLKVVEVADPNAPVDETEGALNLSAGQLASTRLDSILENRLARLWFGGRLKPAQKKDGWLIGAFARDAQHQYAESKGNGAADLFDMKIQAGELHAVLKDKKSVLQLTSGGDSSTVSYDAAAAKAAIVLERIRTKAGTDHYLAVLRRLVTDGKPVSVVQFQDAIKAESGLDAASREISNWINSTGVPEFKFKKNFTKITRHHDGTYGARGWVTQDLILLQEQLNVVAKDKDGNVLGKTQIEISGKEAAFDISRIVSPKPPQIIAVESDENLLTANDERINFLSLVQGGDDYLDAGDYDHAIDSYEAALSNKKRSTLLHFRKGEALYFEQNYSAAAAEFFLARGESQDHKPGWAVAYSYLYIGKIYAAQSDPRAPQAFQRAKDTDTGNWGAAAEAEEYLKAASSYTAKENDAPVGFDSVGAFIEQMNAPKKDEDSDLGVTKGPASKTAPKKDSKDNSKDNSKKKKKK